MPVSMVTTGRLLDKGGDPDCIESHSLDVVELIEDSFECPSTVGSEV